VISQMEAEEQNSILIVDDEKANIIALSHILSPTYDIYTSRNGPDAIEIAIEYEPSMILLDILMPGMDGYMVIEELKSNETTREIPVIFISGLDNAEDEKRGLSLGAADYISKPFNSAVVELRVLNQIKIVNQIRLINKLSITDQLTGIPNRRSLDNQVEREWFRSAREKVPLSMMMLDVDNFKSYNDTYGHQQGDVALQTVAMTMAKTLKRHADFAARWGGEEFAILLPNTETAGAVKIAEQIRNNVEQTPIPLLSGEITRATVSIGLHTMIPTKDCLPCELILKVDKALYAAKETGKNKVCTFEDLE